MPQTKSAKKALRQNKKRRLLNLRYKIKMKRLIKEARSLIKEGKASKALEMLPQVYKAIDKAAKRGVIKKNTAARKKSRLARALNKIKAPLPKKKKTKKTSS